MKKICVIWMICLLIVNLSYPVLAADVVSDRKSSEILSKEQVTADMDLKDSVTPEDEGSPETVAPKETTSDNQQGKDNESEFPTEIGSGILTIDNQNVYEGMERAYKNGYQPLVEKNKATIVVPLLCDGKVRKDSLNAAAELGDTDHSPFVYRTYEKSFKLKKEPINGTKETRDVFLISFALDLDKNRQNGIYPVTILVKGTDENGSEIQQSFTSYVIISDGIDPDTVTDDMGGGTSEGGEKSASSAPVVLISNHTLNVDTVKAGEDFEAVVALKNTSNLKSVQNMVVTVNTPSSEFELKNDSNTIFVGKLGTEKTTDITLRFHVSKSTADGNYPIEIAMSYDDPKANTWSSSGVFMVTVEQPQSLELTMPMIQKEMTAGDTIPLTFQVMNLGRSKAYNVRCDVSCNGLSQTKTAFIGNMESGTEGEGSLNLFVTTMDGEQAYGKTAGKVIMTYEDGFGNEKTQEYAFETTIQEKQIVSQSQSDEEPERASEWWVSILIIAGMIVVIGCSAGSYYLGRKKR
ncbi:MAG: hypothetical protein PUB22_05625 [Clostridiales bacterium]|nr:hypothetical protein [Clostridiales bacterium]